MLYRLSRSVVMSASDCWVGVFVFDWQSASSIIMSSSSSLISLSYFSCAAIASDPGRCFFFSGEQYLPDSVEDDDFDVSDFIDTLPSSSLIINSRLFAKAGI